MSLIINFASLALLLCAISLAWPIAFDQPDNAALLSIKHNVAYHFTEARTGTAGLKPLKCGAQPTGTVEAIQRETREILGKALGMDGRLKRANAVAIQEKMKLAWNVDGEARMEVERLLEKYFPN